LVEHAESGARDGELGHWSALARATPLELPRDFDGENSVASARVVRRRLGAEPTEALLRGVEETLRARTEEALLAGLALGFCRRHRVPSLLVDLESHGRDGLLDDLDLSRTVGWFTALYPVLLEVEGAERAVDVLKKVKEGLRSVPGRGIGFGILRYLRRGGGIADRLRALPRAELLFNYWGQVDRGLATTGLFRPAPEPVRGLVSPRGRRSHLLEVGCRVTGGELEMEWTYSRNQFRPGTVEGWADGFVEALGELVEAARTDGPSAAVPSDFPLMGVNQKQLDRLVGKLEGRRRKR
jgi:non-ribosomal peptide synthase protein (TIGR01720 family)